jgi:hypothetical protein
MAVALLPGLSDAPGLHQLDMSRNSIDEPAGRAFATFITKSSSIRTMNLLHKAM